MTSKKKIIANAIRNIVGVESVELIAVSPETPEHIFCHIYIDTKSVVERLTPEEVQRRNYNATVKRGLITSETQIPDFIRKINEEERELIESWNTKESTFDASELADIVITCESMALHYGIDLQAEKEAKMKINETRND